MSAEEQVNAALKSMRSQISLIEDDEQRRILSSQLERLGNAVHDWRKIWFNLDEWHDMKDAPRDGTPVLIQGPSSSDWPFIGRWQNPYASVRRGHEAWVGHPEGLMDDASCSGWRRLP